MSSILLSRLPKISQGLNLMVNVRPHLAWPISNMWHGWSPSLLRCLAWLLTWFYPYITICPSQSPLLIFPYLFDLWTLKYLSLWISSLQCLHPLCGRLTDGLQLFASSLLQELYIYTLWICPQMFLLSQYTSLSYCKAELCDFLWSEEWNGNLWYSHMQRETSSWIALFSLTSCFCPLPWVGHVPGSGYFFSLGPKLEDTWIRHIGSP